MIAGDQNVSGMKVGVKPELAEWSCSFETVFDTGQNQLSHTLVGRVQLHWYEIVVEQEIARGDSIALDVDCRPVRKLGRFAIKMNARDESSKLLQQAEIVEIR